MTAVQLQARKEAAIAVGEREFPDAARVEVQCYAGEMLLAVWRHWPDGYAARMFGLIGEVIG